jgi:hypothetical protein
MSCSVIGWQAGSDIDDPNSGSAAEQTLAKNALAELVKAYPGYSWFVEVRDQLLMIRNADIDYRGRYCMIRKLSQVHSSYGRLVREVVAAAGEYLERANLRRSARREGEQAVGLEGAPKWAPEPGKLWLPA